MKRNSLAALVAMAMAAALVAGCHVEKNNHGDSKDVSISTPFGGMHVKTNQDVLASIGLPDYPGAQAATDTGDDNHSADVEMSFGGYQLRVKKVGYRTDDAPDKVEAFYRKGLHRFGDVIACRDSHAVGSPTQTPEGLTCDNSKQHGVHIQTEDHAGNDKLELKAGSQHHQHIVEIEPDSGGTKFALVALDLPATGEDQGQ